MQYIDADQDTIVKVLADVLSALCATNDPLPPPQTVNKFYAADVPGISIHDYLIRIKKYAQCSTQCFVLALIYIDKLIQGQHGFIICSLNVHRIVITTIMLAAKFFDDCYYNNRYYARIGGVDAQEMNQLEVEFLFMTNFQLSVTPETYAQYFRQLCDHIAHTSTTIIPEVQRPTLPPPPDPLPAEPHPQDQAAMDHYLQLKNQYQQKYHQYRLQTEQLEQQYQQACHVRNQQIQANQKALPHVVAHKQQLDQHVEDIRELKKQLFDQDGKQRPFPQQQPGNTSMGQE